MAELTREQLIEEAKLKIAIAECHPNSGMARVECELFKIALASLEAEPVAYIFKHPAGKLFWALTDESNKEQSDVIPVYAAAPASVVPDNASASLAYAYKELTPEIMRGHIAVFERYGIAPNDSTTTIQALRIALDGIERKRSDAMLQDNQPVSQTYKLPHTHSLNRLRTSTKCNLMTDALVPFILMRKRLRNGFGQATETGFRNM